MKTELQTKKISLIINYFFMLYAFSIPLSKSLNKYFFVIIVFLWILEFDFKKKYKLILNNRIFQAFIVLISYSYLSTLWSEEVYRSIYYVNRYFYYFIFIILLTSLKKEYINKVLISFFIGMFISEIIIYGIYFDFWSTEYNDKYKDNIPRAVMWHTTYSILISVTSLLALNKLFFRKNNGINILTMFYTILFVSAFLNLLLSGGRIGMVIFIISIIVISIKYLKFYFKKVLLTISILTILFTISYMNITLFKDRVNMIYSDFNKMTDSQYNSSLGIRVALINLGLQISKDHFLLGAGIKDNRELISEYALKEKNKEFAFIPQWHKNPHFHNEYIEILTSIGFIGLILFCYLLYSIATIKIKDTEFHNMKIILITAIIFGITASSIFHNRYVIAIFALFIGILLAQSRFEIEKREKNLLQ